MRGINVKSEATVSIIVPVYNAEQYLSECLDSLLGQTYKKIEILCVNDGSKDNSLQILREYQKRDVRIKVIDKINKGVSRARNDAIRAATGEYIMYVDSDDWLDNKACETILKKMVETNADVILFPYIRENVNSSLKKEIYGEDEIIYDEIEVRRKLHRRYIGALGKELAKPENVDALCPVWGKMYKTDIIKENNIQFIDLEKIGTYEDGMFNLYYFEYVTKAVYYNKYFYHYRKTNNQSITTRYNEKLYIQWNCLFDLMEKYIAKKELSKEYKEALNNRISLSILGLGLNIIASDYNCIRKIQEISKIISSERYRNAYKNLQFKHFPIYRRLFYKFAKYRFAPGIYMLLKVIFVIRG